MPLIRLGELLGLVTVSTRRNAVGVLMGVELILNGANVNFPTMMVAERIADAMLRV